MRHMIRVYIHLQLGQIKVQMDQHRVGMGIWGDIARFERRRRLVKLLVLAQVGSVVGVWLVRG